VSRRAGSRRSRANRSTAAVAGGSAVAQGPAAGRTLEIEGELTIQTAADRRGALLAMADGGSDLDLDLSAVTELDTAGLQLLLLARREAELSGHRLTVSGASQAVRDVLAIAQLTSLLGATGAGDDAAEVRR